jgi:hypothetical protein
MKPPIKPVMLSEVEASMVLSNWGPPSGYQVALSEMVARRPWSVFLRLHDAYGTDRIAACITVKAPRVRSGSKGRKR